MDYPNYPIEIHPFTPFLPMQARVMVLGSFPPPKSKWKMNFYYPNWQNDMWRIFGLVFFKNKNYFLDIEKQQFKENLLHNFLNQKGIAICDNAQEIIRLKGNASDQFLHVIKPIDLSAVLQKLPNCQYLLTIGEKSLQILLTILPFSLKPKIGEYVTVYFTNRILYIYRLPSSSRAYPLSIEKKAEIYERVFQRIFQNEK